MSTVDRLERAVGRELQALAFFGVAVGASLVFTAASLAAVPMPIAMHAAWSVAAFSMVAFGLLWQQARSHRLELLCRLRRTVAQEPTA